MEIIDSDFRKKVTRNRLITEVPGEVEKALRGGFILIHTVPGCIQFKWNHEIKYFGQGKSGNFWITCRINLYDIKVLHSISVFPASYYVRTQNNLIFMDIKIISYLQVPTCEKILWIFVVYSSFQSLHGQSSLACLFQAVAGLHLCSNTHLHRDFYGTHKIL